MKTNATFRYTDKPKLTINGFDIKLRENGDFWRLHLDYDKLGMNRELGVYSHHQKQPNVVEKDGSTIITYPEVIAEDGSVHNIKLVLTINNVDGELEFFAEMTNNSETRLNELQYPLFEFNKINGDFEQDVAYIPDGLGRKVPNPHGYTIGGHSEYMKADYKNIWKIHTYPWLLSMPWVGIVSGENYFHLASHMEKWRMTSFVFGAEPRESTEKYLITAISSYPAVIPGETLTYGPYVIAGYENADWREGADHYRAWSERTWMSHTKKASFDHIHGWQRIILEHQYGEIFHTYEDLPDIYRYGAKFGIKLILLFGWWKGGMDNDYPNYEPDPALGGAKKLKEAIDEINKMGGTVILYASGHLIDVSTEYYKKTGYKFTMKDIENNEYREFYKFSNNGTILTNGHKTFAAGCHGAKEWRDKLLEITDLQLSLGSNGSFFDQLGCCYNLCFDSSHDHGNRIDEDPEYRLMTSKAIKEALPEGMCFGSEWALDRFIDCLDFIHGCGFGQWFSADSYPFMFRYTFPEIPISNRLIHDEKANWMRHLNYAFSNGLIFDISIYRGRAVNLDVVPNYMEYIGKLVDLRTKYLPFFTKGKFDMYPSDFAPEGIRGAVMSYDGKKIATVWNDSPNDITFMGKTYKSQEVGVVEI